MQTPQMKLSPLSRRATQKWPDTDLPSADRVQDNLTEFRQKLRERQQRQSVLVARASNQARELHL